MIAQNRLCAILEILATRQSVTLPQLGRRLRASPATVRRDVTLLAGLGKVVRTHGGVLHPDSRGAELSFESRSRDEQAAKRAIGQVAADLVTGRATVYVDAGTTALHVGRQLLAQDGLTIVTNSIPLLGERITGRDTRLIALGGEVRSVSLALVNSDALAATALFRFDWAFLGASGADAGFGATTTELSEAASKKAAMARARHVVLVADHSKWGKNAQVRFADWQQITDVVSDRALTAPALASLRRVGVRVYLATRKYL